jgi:ABC-type glycerol-3-phosphate transport system substrate-binding protein
MKRALIAIASVGFLSSTAWVVAANAQANLNPNLYPNNASERYGVRPFPAGGPVRSGNRCRTEIDSTRGYGFMKDCPAPKAAASASTRALSARASAAPRAAAPARKHKAVSSR